MAGSHGFRRMDASSAVGCTQLCRGSRAAGHRLALCVNEQTATVNAHTIDAVPGVWLDVSLVVQSSQ